MRKWITDHFCRKQDIQDSFTPKMFRRLMVPSLMSSIGLAFGDMADAVVVGQEMGAVGLAAISLSLPLYMVYNVFMHGLGIGGSISFSQLLGEGKKEEAVRCYNQVMQTGILIGLLIAAVVNLFPESILRLLGTVPSDGALYETSRIYLRMIALGAPLFFINYMLNYFLRNDNCERLAGAGFLLGNVTDIVLNLVFVLWLGMGIQGAALATLIGLTVGIASYLPAVLSSEHYLRPFWYRVKTGEVFSCFKTGFATSSQYVFQMIFLLIVNNVLMELAAENGVAVFDLLQNASYLVLYLYEGCNKAMQPLISTFYGEKNPEAAAHTRRLGLTWGTLIGAAAALLIFLFPETVCRIFGLDSAELIHLGSQALRIYCSGTVFAGISIMLETCYQSFKEEKSAFMIALLRGCAVLLPCTVVFSVLPLPFFWFLYPFTELASLGIFLFWKKKYGTDTAAFDTARLFRETIRNGTKDMAGLTDRLEAFCVQWHASVKQKYFVVMSVEEVCMAIITRGFGAGKTGEIQITVAALETGEFELHVRDSAESFNPFSLQTAKVGKKQGVDLDAMGMMVIRSQAKDFFYRHYQGFNSLTIRI